MSVPKIMFIALYVGDLWERGRGESYINIFTAVFGCVYSLPLTSKKLGFLKHKPSGH